MSLWWTLLGKVFAATSVPSFQHVPFVLGPEGVHYLGWLTPRACPSDSRFRCDVVVVDPRTGKLVIQQSDDATMYRRYLEKTWYLSNHITVEEEQQRLLHATDVWGVETEYSYQGSALSEVRWSDGRILQIEYDRKGRVTQLTEGEHEWTFIWGKEGHHKALSKDVLQVEWFVNDAGIQVKNSMGLESTLLLSDDQIVGWIDPRGVTTNLQSTNNGWTISQGGLRNWTVEQQDNRLTAVLLEGSGAWRWGRDATGHLTEIVDPVSRRLEILRNNGHTDRLLRSNGFIDFQYDTEQWLVDILDVSGRLVHIERDQLGLITHIEDAVGETFQLERTAEGYIKRLVLRDGQEWNIEYDALGQVRTIVQPDQIVWSIERTGGRVSKVSKSYAEPIRVSWMGSHWTRLEQVGGDQLTVVRDAQGRVTRLQDATGAVIQLQYDILGQITEIQLADHIWRVQRDAFGQVVEWNELSIQRGVWGSIVETQVDDLLPWQWKRDSSGRLIELSSNEAITIHYNGMGSPIQWERDQHVQEVTYNHWGWPTKMNGVWLKHDSRGMVRKVGMNDLQWQFNRDAAGRVLVLKGPYGAQMGLNYDLGVHVSQLRFPSGQLQHQDLTPTGIQFAHTNDNGQRTSVSKEEISLSWSLPQTSSLGIEGALFDAVGVQTWPHEDDVQVIEYDPFYFVRQVCDLSSCLQFGYDPRGRLQSIDDGSGLPINLIWGWTGWTEAPLVIGGTVGVYSNVGMSIQTDGLNYQEYMYWPEKIKGIEEVDDVLMIDSAQYVDGELRLNAVPLMFKQNVVRTAEFHGQLQNEFPWVSIGLEGELFAIASQTSVWHDPVALMMGMGMVKSLGWLQIDSPQPFEWLSDPFGEPQFSWSQGVQSMPIQEPAMEEILLKTLVEGKSDPDINEILRGLVGDELLKMMLAQNVPLAVIK